MPYALLTTTLNALLLAFNDFDKSLDDVGCDDPLAVCDKDALLVLASLATAFNELVGQVHKAHDEFISDNEYELLTNFMARIDVLKDSEDDAGCDDPYTVVDASEWLMTLSLRDRVAGWLQAKTSSVNTALRDALTRNMKALDDLIAISAPEFSKKVIVAQAKTRIRENGGKLAYIADVLEQGRTALAQDYL